MSLNEALTDFPLNISLVFGLLFTVAANTEDDFKFRQGGLIKLFAITVAVHALVVAAFESFNTIGNFCGATSNISLVEGLSSL